jgi:hypothetical protein
MYIKHFLYIVKDGHYNKVIITSIKGIIVVQFTKCKKISHSWI